jgi:SAM-dependent methyltransferase
MEALDFSRRSGMPELMDTEVTGFEEFRACLVDLERVNFWTLTYRPMMGFLARLSREGRIPRDRPFTVVDVGSGYGGMLRRIDRWAEKRGIAVELTGIDLNPWSAAASVEATAPGRPIRWLTMDLFDYRAPGPIDLIVCSQFTHHLDDAALVRFIEWMEDTAQLGWFISDLHRHRLPYYVFSVWSRLAGWHRFVRNDGPISVARSFVADDWRGLLDEAGIPPGLAKIEWWMPFRLCVSRVRP